MVVDSGVLMSPKDSRSITLEASPSFKEWQIRENELEFTMSFKMGSLDSEYSDSIILHRSGNEPYSSLDLACCHPGQLLSPSCNMELDEAALKLQKVYKSYRTRRNLADCAVIAEELWWKALDYATLNRSSVSFFEDEKSESTVSRWARASTRAAKVGKGLSKDEKAQKLALRHWLEAIDPRHRYGHNLNMYYEMWFKSESTQPFFYWLDIGDGKELVLEKCPRHILQRQTIKYLGPKEREAYEVVVRNGKLVYRMSEQLVNTTKDSKWIFVLSTSRNLYVGKKMKGRFQHSSFLAGAATTAAGRLVAKDGILMAIWPYSGHYLPTRENFKDFISYLSENNVDLTNVKKNAVDDDDYPSFRELSSRTEIGTEVSSSISPEASGMNRIEMNGSTEISIGEENSNEGNPLDHIESPKFEFDDRLQCKWATGAGPRIGCVRDYPVDLQVEALEQVNLSPRPPSTPTGNKVPIPSPRPRSMLRLSPRMATMGIPSPIQDPGCGHFVVPSPRVTLTLPNLKKR